MSIDYDVVFGIGYEVEVSGDTPEDYSLEEYVEQNLQGFKYFVTGNNYSGEDDVVYIILKEPFSNGLDLTHKKALLEMEIERLDLDFVSTFGVVGGVHVW